MAMDSQDPKDHGGKSAGHDPRSLQNYLLKHLPKSMALEVLQRLESGDADSRSLGEYHGSTLDTSDADHTQIVASTVPLSAMPNIGELATRTQYFAGSAPSENHTTVPNSASSPPLIKAGTRIQHFQVQRLLGRGGMGEVYLARDGQLGRKVALKVIRQSHLRDDKSLARFLNEARITARFNHPHIVTIYAVGKFEGLLYVALEYLEGQDLWQRMKEEPPSLQESLRICRAVSEAIAEAHSHGVLHRDLKPANILIPKDGRVRVVDFGLAKELELGNQSGSPDNGAPQGGERQKGRMVGTPAYMSPEQWHGQDATPAADVWALGVIFHELVTGQRPYIFTDAMSGGVQVCAPEPVPLHDDVKVLPPRLLQLLEECLDKTASRRPTAQHCADLFRETLADGRRPPSVSESPFRGLLPFAERHANVFFGRDTELTEAVERLRYESALVIVGSSGAGKTSFVQAGLIPRLKENHEWHVIRFRPGEQPIERLASRILSAQANETESASMRTSVGDHSWSGTDDVAAADTRQAEIEDFATKIRKSPNKASLSLQHLAQQRESRVLVVIDQLEELFTLCREPLDQDLFLEVIASLADESNLPLRVLCTVRDDFLGRITRTGDSARTLLEHIMVLEPPSAPALKEVLTLPLIRTGYQFDDAALPDDMVAALGDSPNLPLLQFAARSLWDSRDQIGRTLRRSDYEAMGGVEGALAKHADGVLDGLGDDELRLARTLLLRLVTPEETRKVMAETALLDGLPQTAARVFERLTKSRLLATRRSSLNTDDSTRIELAHDSLIHTWDTLARWIEESKEELVVLAEVSQAAMLWDRRGRRTEELWTGDGLRDAVRLLYRTQDELPSLVLAFLEAGQNRAERLRKRRRFWLISVPVISLIVVGILALQKVEAEFSRESSERGRQQAIAQRESAEEERKTAQRRHLESLRESAQSAYDRGAFLEARAKLRRAFELSSGAPDGFHGLWWQLNATAESWLLEHGAFFYRAAFAPNGQQVAASSIDGTVHLLDVDTRDHTVLRGHIDQTIGLAYSPTSTHLATGGLSPYIRIWDLSKNEEIARLAAPKGIVSHIRYSPDGKQLVAFGNENQISIWRLSDQRLTHAAPSSDTELLNVTFDANSELYFLSKRNGALVTEPINALGAYTVIHRDFSRNHRYNLSDDGRRLAVLTPEDAVVVYEMPHGQRIGGVKGPISFDGTFDNMFALSTNGTHLALEGPRGVIQTYDVLTGTRKGGIQLRKRRPSRLALSTNGQHLAEPALEYLRLSTTEVPYDDETDDSVLKSVYALAIDPLGKEIISSNINNEMVRRSTATGNVLPPIPMLEGANRDSVHYDPTGRYLAWVSTNRTLRIWDRQLQQSVFSHPNILGHPNGLRFDGQGRRIVLVTDREMRAWDVSTGRQQLNQTWSDKRETSLDVSNDGRTAIVGFGGIKGAMSGWAELWNLDTGKRIRRLTGKDAYTLGVAIGPRSQWFLTPPALER